MVALRSYTARFKNQYGEEWEFQYDPAKGEGVLRGSDVDWGEYAQGQVSVRGPRSEASGLVPME